MDKINDVVRNRVSEASTAWPFVLQEKLENEEKQNECFAAVKTIQQQKQTFVSALQPSDTVGSLSRATVVTMLNDTAITSTNNTVVTLSNYIVVPSLHVHDSELLSISLVPSQLKSAPLPNGTSATQCYNNNVSRDALAETWKPTPMFTMFDKEISELKIRMSNVKTNTNAAAQTNISISAATNVAEVLESESVANWKNAFDERMTNLQLLLDDSCTYVNKLRNEHGELKEIVGCIAENHTTHFDHAHLHTICNVLAQKSTDSVADFELLKKCIKDLTADKSVSKEKHSELVEIVNIIAENSITAENYSKLEALVDSIARNSVGAEKSTNFVTPVTTKARELAQLCDEVRKTDARRSELLKHIGEISKVKDTGAHLETELFILSAMVRECQAYSKRLQDRFIAMNRQLKQGMMKIICDIVDEWVKNENQLSIDQNNRQLDAGQSECTPPIGSTAQEVCQQATKQYTIQSLSNPNYMKKLPKSVKCVIVGDSDVGKT